MDKKYTERHKDSDKELSGVIAHYSLSDLWSKLFHSDNITV